MADRSPWRIGRRGGSVGRTPSDGPEARLRRDGSPDLRNVIRARLQDESYNATTTNFVVETFDQVAALEPELLIVDLALHEGAG